MGEEINKWGQNQTELLQFVSGVITQPITQPIQGLTWHKREHITQPIQGLTVHEREPDIRPTPWATVLLPISTKDVSKATAKSNATYNLVDTADCSDDMCNGVTVLAGLGLAALARFRARTGFKSPNEVSDVQQAGFKMNLTKDLVYAPISDNTIATMLLRADINPPKRKPAGARDPSYALLLAETVDAFSYRIDAGITYLKVEGVVALLYNHENYANKVDFLLENGVFEDQNDITASTKIVLQTLAVHRNPNGTRDPTKSTPAHNIFSLFIQAGEFSCEWIKGIVHIIIHPELIDMVNMQKYISSSDTTTKFRDVFFLFTDQTMIKDIKAAATDVNMGSFFKPFDDAITNGLSQIRLLSEYDMGIVSHWFGVSLRMLRMLRMCIWFLTNVACTGKSHGL